jgi:hypothetical protein
MPRFLPHALPEDLIHSNSFHQTQRDLAFLNEQVYHFCGHLNGTLKIALMQETTLFKKFRIKEMQIMRQ